MGHKIKARYTILIFQQTASYSGAIDSLNTLQLVMLVMHRDQTLFNKMKKPILEDSPFSQNHFLLIIDSLTWAEREDRNSGLKITCTCTLKVVLHISKTCQHISSAI